jgi:hypothetical protein
MDFRKGVGNGSFSFGPLLPQGQAPPQKIAAAY